MFTLEEAKVKLAGAGQEHLLQYFDELDEAAADWAFKSDRGIGSVFAGLDQRRRKGSAKGKTGTAGSRDIR